jgi:hypothetical protein
MDEPITVRELEVCELEAWRDCAAHEREPGLIHQFCAEPVAGADYYLKRRGFGCAKMFRRVSAIAINHMYEYVASRMEMPDLIRLQAVKF